MDMRAEGRTDCEMYIVSEHLLQSYCTQCFADTHVNRCISFREVHKNGGIEKLLAVDLAMQCSVATKTVVEVTETMEHLGCQLGYEHMDTSLNHCAREVSEKPWL